MRFFYWLYYIFVFFPAELIKASFEMIHIILFPRNNIRPAIVAIPLDLKTEWGVITLANTISLTPGTLTLDVSPDRKTLYVHCIAVEDPDAFRRSIKEDYEAKVRRLEGSL